MGASGLSFSQFSSCSTRADQCSGAFGGKGNQARQQRLMHESVGRRGRRRLFEDGKRVGAADSKAIESSAPRRIRSGENPAALCSRKKATTGKSMQDWRLIVDARWNSFVMQHERGLDQTGNSRCLLRDDRYWPSPIRRHNTACVWSPFGRPWSAPRSPADRRHGAG